MLRLGLSAQGAAIILKPMIIAVKVQCLSCRWLTGVSPTFCRKLAVFDTWSSLAVHIAMDNTVVMEEISKWLGVSPDKTEELWVTRFPC